jgi:hypothetical protein
MATKFDANQFRASMRALGVKNRERTAAVARQAIQELAYRVVDATPLDTGFLRGSWQPSLNEIGTKDVPSTDSTGALAKAEIGITLSDLKIGDTYYLVNNAAYAARLEFGFTGKDKLGRYYNQAGRFYVRSNVAAFPTIVKSTIASLGR